MKDFFKSEKFVYIAIAACFLLAFLGVYLKTERRLVSVRDASPVVIYDVITEKAPEEEKTVYITRSGKKYHLDGCDYLSEKKMAVSLSDALKAGYESCAYCQP